MSKPKSPLDGLSGGSDYNGSGNGNDKNPSTVADKLLAIITPHIVELFEDQYNNPYVVVKIDGRIEAIRIPVTHFNSGLLKKWIGKVYYESTQRVMINTDAVTAVSNHLAWQASLVSTNKRTLDLRVSYGQSFDVTTTIYDIDGTSNNKTIYYDLTNGKGDVVAITKDGWSVKKSTDVPVMFERRSIQRAQISPSPSGGYPQDIFEQFMDLLNVRKDGNDRLLLMCYIISLFIPKISKVILMLHGPEGAAKSACQLLIKWLVDPTSTRLLKLRMKEDDLILQLAHNYLVYYDNLTDIPEWISDLFCQAATGTSFSKRMLYSDDQEIVFELTRAIGFNGINLAANRADILDRGLNIELEGIDETRMKSFEKEIIPQFERLKPFVLSYIFDIVSKVLAFESETFGQGLELKSRSRMADWEEYAEIISRCIGFKPFQFLDAYRANREKKTEVILEETPIAQALVKLMVLDKLQQVANGNGSDSWSQGFNQELIWTGSPSQLLAILKPIAIDDLNIDIRQNELWPKAPNVLSKRLVQVSSSLKKLGISISRGHNTKTKMRSIEIIKIPSPSSPSSPSEYHAHITSDSGDDTGDDTRIGDDTEKIPSPETGQNRAQNGVSDGCDDSDDTGSTSTEDPLPSNPESASNESKPESECDLRNQEGADRFRAQVERLNKLADKDS